MQIDTRGFDGFIRSLTELTGKPRTEVLLTESAKVLEICIARSPGPSSLTPKLRKQVQHRVEKPARYVDEGGSKLSSAWGARVPRPMTRPFLQTLTGTRGGIAGNQWYVGTDRKGKVIKLHGSWLQEWGKYQRVSAVRGSLLMGLDGDTEKAVAAVGSLKKSWMHIADKLGISLRVKASSFIRRRTNQYDDGARSRLVKEGPAVFVELVNTNGGLIKRHNGAAILAGAVQTRVRFFERAARNDWLSDIKFRAKYWPGLTVSD